MFELLYYCGLRRGEARGLQWTDIGWNDHTISITKQATSVKDEKHEYELTPPKTKKSIRTLPIVDILYNDLQELHAEKKKCYGFNEKWFVFGTFEPLTFYKMQSLGWETSKRADIRHLPLHGFRHSCASLLINVGQDPTTVSKYLGHASIKETLDTYSHMFPNNLNSAKNAIDNLNKTFLN
jgi:integrase